MESSHDQKQKVLKSHTPRGSILKTSSSMGTGDQGMATCPESHTHEVKFDEETIAEHDKDRGTRTKIDEPKTPYEEATQEHLHGDVEMHAEGGSGHTGALDEGSKQIDEEIKNHLEEAERNKMLNAQLLHQ